MNTALRKYGWKHGRPYLYQVETVTNRAQKVANSANENEYRDWSSAPMARCPLRWM